MIFFRRYEPGDIWEIMTNKVLSELGYGIDEKYIDVDHTWTLVDDLKVLGCAGFRFYWNGVYEAWLHPLNIDVMNKHKFLIVHKIIKEINNLDAHRIQANISASLDRNIKFMETVGFKIEAMLEKYGPMKEDFLILAIVR